jgi:hypothetical protein
MTFQIHGPTVNAPLPYDKRQGLSQAKIEKPWLCLSIS